jgi:DNA-binding winged helix-turn-helix (wHTH) protein
MEPPTIKNFEFGPFLLDMQGQCLIKGGEQIPLQPKAFAVLLHLLQHAGLMVSRDDLLASIWGLSISDGVLSFQISQLRKLLGDLPSRPKYIKTITKRGFQFVAPVREVDLLAPPAVAERLVKPSLPSLDSDPPKPPPSPADTCLTSAARPLTPAYRFGHASPDERRAMEAHLCSCASCRQELQRLQVVLRGGLDSAGDLQRSLSASDPAQPRGISVRLDRPFGGHSRHVLTACILYAGLYAVTLLIEIAYQFDIYGSSRLNASLWVGLWVFGTSMVGLIINWKSASKGKPNGLMVSLLIFLAATAGLYAGVCLLLPSLSITGLAHQAETAQAAYFRDTGSCLLMAVFFLIPTFHFVITMQRELQAGRHRLAFEVLTGNKPSVLPAGTFYPSFKGLGLALIMMAAFSVYHTVYLLGKLSPGPYKSLFIGLLYLRLILYYGFGLQCLGWYYRALNDLRRQSRAAANIGGDQVPMVAAVAATPSRPNVCRL